MSNDTQVAAHMALVDDYAVTAVRRTQGSGGVATLDDSIRARAAVEASARQLAEQGAPANSVKIPTGEDEAALMLLLSMDWLKRHAPHRLKHPEQGAPTRNWADAVQSFADELELPFLEAKSFLDEVFPQWMANKEAAGFVTLRLDDLIEGDSYGVDGSDFYRCRICHAESGAGMLNNGIKHEHDCPLAARPLTASPTAPSTEASEPVRDERADLIAQAGEEMSFEAWFKTMCPVDGINAKIAARAAWQAARASKGTPL